MPVKKDDSGRRWVEMAFLVRGTPEQVWRAIATGPGMSAWFTRPLWTNMSAGQSDSISARGTAARTARPEPSPRGTRQPGSVAVLGTFAMGDAARAVVSVFFYGANAAEIAAAERAKWNGWLCALLEGDKVSG
jgi:hypothetical protein